MMMMMILLHYVVVFAHWPQETREQRHRSMVWWKAYFDTLNRIVSLRVLQTDGRTDILVANATRCAATRLVRQKAHCV